MATHGYLFSDERFGHESVAPGFKHERLKIKIEARYLQCCPKHSLLKKTYEVTNTKAQ